MILYTVIKARKVVNKPKFNMQVVIYSSLSRAAKRLLKIRRAIHVPLSDSLSLFLPLIFNTRLKHRLAFVQRKH